MRKWIHETFGIKVNNNDEEVFVFESEGMEIEANLEIFLRLFNKVDAPNYTNFINADPENKTGWHKHFNEWKEKGILN